MKMLARLNMGGKYACPFHTRVELLFIGRDASSAIVEGLARPMLQSLRARRGHCRRTGRVSEAADRFCDFRCESAAFLAARGRAAYRGRGRRRVVIFAGDTADGRKRPIDDAAIIFQMAQKARCHRRSKVDSLSRRIDTRRSDFSARFSARHRRRRARRAFSFPHRGAGADR